jgi:hypothetical protein
MNMCSTRTSLKGALILSIFATALIPTRMSADYSTIKRVAIVGSIAGALLIVSENARRISTKAFYKAIIGSLHMMQHMPVSDETHQKIANLIAEYEALYVTRSGDKFTGDHLKALLKEFKELMDACIAAKTLGTWVRDAA